MRKITFKRRRLEIWLPIFVGVLFLSVQGFAQKTPVKGVVTSSDDGLPIPGVSVIIKGAAKGTITDFDGNYTINAKLGQEISFSFIGMKTKTVKITKGKHNVVLKSEVIGLDEVVAIGYGTQKKKELTGAVVQVKSKDIQRIATSDLGSALQGQIAGVSIQASSGEPGSSSNIQIRGISSITGSNSPLYVVDGVPQNEDPRLSSSEIETIDVLKDAASASIYGTRGAGGVILITTKRGKSGQMQISYDGYSGVQKITSGLELMNFEDFMYQSFVAKRHSVPSAFPSEDWSAIENSPHNFTNNTNMISTMENDNARIQNHSINVTGGKKDLTYSIVGSYFDQEGIVINSGFERYNFRANTSFEKGRITIRTGLGMRMEKKTTAPGDLMYQAYKYKPYQSYIDPNQEEIIASGPATNNDAQNKGTLAAKFKQSDVKDGDKFNGNIDLKFKIAKGLYLTTQAAFSRDNSLRVLINPQFDVTDEEGTTVINTNTRSRVRNTHDRRTSLTWESGFNYSKKFGDHSLRALGIISTEEYTYTKFLAEGRDIFNNLTPVLGGTTAEPSIGSGTDYTKKLVGMLGRLQYSYKGKYNLSVSARRDGSTQFSKKNKWGTFPSASVGWNLSDEKFWKPIKKVANSFKIRASYGTTGNQNFAPYSNAASITSGYDYAFGDESNGSLNLGGIQTDYANPNVKWETTIQRNLGIDIGMYKNRFTLSADFYNTDKNDMLFPLLLPYTTGAGKNANVILNVGDMNNKGMELAAGYRNSGKFTWSIRGTFTKNINEVTSMSGSNKISFFSNGTATNNGDKLTAVAEGYEAGAFFLMETNGIVNTEQKLAEYQRLEPTAKMGDLIYIDQDGNNKLEDADRIYSGCGAPEWEVGLNLALEYKGIDFSMNWFGAYGNEIVNGSKMYTYDFDTHKDLMYQWSEDNPYATIPANRGGKHMNYRAWNDTWIEDGSYIRLRNVTLGYSIPKTLMNKLSVTKCRIYIASENPLTITKYTGYDPEVGNDGLATRGIDKGNYPISSQYRVGLQLSF